MSYDLMVFEQSAAPNNRRDFMIWYEQQTEWAEDHGYDDPSVTSAALKNWFMEMKETFPPLNDTTDEEIKNMKNVSYLTDYSIGREVIYVAFRWSLAGEAYEKMKLLALKHGVGFFDVSSNDCDIIFPDGTTI
jgi:GH35 family endo-1,4-beta-xylanase